MSESLQAIFEHVIWSVCYLSVLLGLSAFGIHRYLIIYLFLKNRRRRIEPAARFRSLPTVTVQLPVYNEYYVIRRLIEQSASSIIRATNCRSRSLMIPPTRPRRSPPAKSRGSKPKASTSTIIIAITEQVSRRSTRRRSGRCHR